MKATVWRSCLGLACVAAACSTASGEVTPPLAAKPAVIERSTSLDDLTRVRLRPDAVEALGIVITQVERVHAARRLIVGGEVMVPAGREIVLAAPVGGRIATGAISPAGLHPGDRVSAGQTLLRFLPLASLDRDVRARADRELSVAHADVELARTRAVRAEAMAADRSGSQRALEDARALYSVAQSSQRAAEARLRTLDSGALDSDVALVVHSPVTGVLRSVRVAAGQSVPSGAPLIEIAAEGRWVRATFPASDAAKLSDLREVRARRLGGSEAVSLTPMLGPPSADPARGTVDRFFVLPQGPHTEDWVPGERILVEVVGGEANTGVQAVPFGAVVHDAAGSAWVYEVSEPNNFVRRRVEPLRRDGQRWLLARGPAVGAQIVATGAAELWGFELGADR